MRVSSTRMTIVFYALKLGVVSRLDPGTYECPGDLVAPAG
jgi:hypothetical protein